MIIREIVLSKTPRNGNNWHTRTTVTFDGINDNTTYSGGHSIASALMECIGHKSDVEAIDHIIIDGIHADKKTLLSRLFRKTKISRHGWLYQNAYDSIQNLYMTGGDTK